MGIAAKHQKEVFSLTGIQKLTFIVLIVSLSDAFINTIWAVYMDSFIHSIVLVGFLSAGLTLISFFSYLFFIPLIEKTSKTKIYSHVLLLFIITYLLFSINANFYLFIFLAILLTILSTLKITSFGIIIKDHSAKKALSKNEGIIYTFRNVAWVLGPLIAGYFAGKSGVSSVFILASLLLIIGFLGFKILRVKDKNIQKKTDNGMIKNFFAFFRDRNRVNAYLLSGGIAIWWTLIYLFIPLEIIRNNLSTAWVGYFLFGAAFPLILLEYYFSKLALKTGFKKMFKIGFLIPCIFSLFSFFTTNIFLIMLFLIISSIGMAMLEPTIETYFFTISNKKQMLRFYGPYNTTLDSSRFIGKISASILLIFLPFKFIFILFSIFMFIMFLICFRIREIVNNK